MIVKSTAVVLRIAPFSETSQVVTWLTPAHGKLATMVKGALRRDSAFQGHYDLFCLCELLFYERRHAAMHIAGECAMLKPRLNLRRDWKAAARASYLANLLDAWMPQHAVQPACFQLLDAALDALASGMAPDALVPWFELRLLHGAGLTPGLRVCQLCRQALLPGGGAGMHAARSDTGLGPGELFFAPVHGGALCARCNAGHRAPDIVRVTPDVLGVLGFWQDAADWNAARRMRCTPRQWHDAMDLLGLFVRYHLEVSDRARRIMLEITSLPDCVCPGERI